MLYYKKIYLITLALFPFMLNAQMIPLAEKYQRLPLGAIKPAGWIKTQMESDMKGFVGHLDSLVPELIRDPIYAEGRLHKTSKAKDLGNLKSGDAEGDDQYKWWNSETQSNWWDGFIRNAVLLDDHRALKQVEAHVAQILATQDTDGYLGIYDPELRYRFVAENGELWAKTTLFRGLLAWYEYTRDTRIWDALVKAVDNVLRNYPPGQSDPFNAGQSFSGGVAHGLMFTDICDRMYQLSGELRYWQYAVFLYTNFSSNYSSEKDAQLRHIQDTTYRLQSHGVHTYEHLRALTVAAFAAGSPDLQAALNTYRQRIERATTPSGGAIGDEWIGGRAADATHTGYEYCSLQELLDSYTVLFQKSGDPAAAEWAERIFFNAAQGARHPQRSGIAYLKTDNAFEMTGTRNGEAEPGRNQTRYKYSPVHQDVAVCCSPNAGRITPYFVQSMWVQEGDNTLVAALLGPNILRTMLHKTPLAIETVTEYPYAHAFTFKISLETPLAFTLKLRKPAWATNIETSENYHLEGDFIVIHRLFQASDTIRLRFGAQVRITGNTRLNRYISYGPLLYARPIRATEKPGRVYAEGFEDWYYAPAETTRYAFITRHRATWREGKIHISLRNLQTKRVEAVELVPLGRTILRQAAF